MLAVFSTEESIGPFSKCLGGTALTSAPMVAPRLGFRPRTAQRVRDTTLLTIEEPRSWYEENSSVWHP